MFFAALTVEYIDVWRRLVGMTLVGFNLVVLRMPAARGNKLIALQTLDVVLLEETLRKVSHAHARADLDSGCW